MTWNPCLVVLLVESSSFFRSDYASHLEPLSCTLRYVPVKSSALFKVAGDVLSLYCSNTFSDVGMYGQALVGPAEISQTSSPCSGSACYLFLPSARCWDRWGERTQMAAKSCRLSDPSCMLPVLHPLPRGG